MWPFTKKYDLEGSGLMNGFTDWHCHVLPGVDDGIRDIEDSLKVLETYEEVGVSTVWLTPHIMEDMPNTTDGLRRTYDKLMAAYKGRISVNLAAENMLDNLFEARLKDADFLPIGKNKDHLLVETSYFTPPHDFHDKLARTFNAGLFALLAHPERYIYMDYDDYDDLHERGVKMQLNLSSLFGFYGHEAKDKAMYILENGYYNAIGTDTHRFNQVMVSLEKGRLTKKTLNMLKLIPGID